MYNVPTFRLNNGIALDQLGFGLYKVPPSDAFGLVTEALEEGYRSIDTAAMYDNERGVGEAVRNFTGEGSATSREDVFVTTKVWNDQHGFESTLKAFDASLQELGLDYVDLYLIHWPCPERGKFIETYKALEKLYREGRVRAIGVSNFQPDHLRLLLDAVDVVPAVNQIELHPWLQQQRLRELHDQLGIRTEAWSPLGRASVLEDPVLQRIAAEVGRTVAQVVLRWHLQLGNIVIPKASSRARIRENIRLFDFTLDEEAMDAIAAVDRNQRVGSHPDKVN